LHDSPRSLATKEYVDAQSGGGGALKELNEGNGLGWTIQCRIDNNGNYGDIGKGALDFSASREAGNFGARGEHSFAIGLNTTSSGANSQAFGQSTVAKGISAHTIGTETQANGDNSHAEGRGTVAQNDDMHAQGRYNIGTSSDTVHEIGIGYLSSGNITRKNGFEVYMALKYIQTVEFMLLSRQLLCMIPQDH